MKLKTLTLLAGALLVSIAPTAVLAAGKTIAVSWKTFQEERWKIDEAAIKAVVEAAGDTARLCFLLDLSLLMDRNGRLFGDADRLFHNNLRALRDGDAASGAA